MSSYWWKDSFTNISIERQIDAEQDAFCAAVAQQTAQFWATRNPMCFWPMMQTSATDIPVWLPPEHPVRLQAVETAKRLLDLRFDVQYPTHAQPSTYLPPEHPVRISAQRRAQAYRAGCTTDIGRSTNRASVDLGNQPVYAKTTTLHRRKTGNEAKYLKHRPDLGEFEREAEFWQPEHMGESEQSFAFEKSACFADPLVQLLRRERADEIADELEHRHGAGSSNNTLKFYMQQRPDTQELQAAGNAWTTATAPATQTEVKPYIRNRKAAA